MRLADELQKLHELRQAGALSRSEFARAKASLLSPPRPSSPASRSQPADGVHMDLLLRLAGTALALGLIFLVLVPMLRNFEQSSRGYRQTLPNLLQSLPEHLWR